MDTIENLFILCLLNGLLGRVWGDGVICNTNVHAIVHARPLFFPVYSMSCFGIRKTAQIPLGVMQR